MRGHQRLIGRSQPSPSITWLADIKPWWSHLVASPSPAEPLQGPLDTYFHATTRHECLAPPRVGLRRPEALPVNEVTVALNSFCIFSLNVLIYEIEGTASAVVLPHKKKKSRLMAHVKMNEVIWLSVSCRVEEGWSVNTK